MGKYVDIWHVEVLWYIMEIENMAEGKVQHREGLYGFEFLEEDGRRVPADERKTPEIKALWQRNHEIINLSIKGYKGTEIAEILNIHPQTVSNTLNSELGKRKISDITYEKDIEVKKTIEKVRILSNKALETYHEFFDDEGNELSLKDKREGAKDFLNDMSGLRAPTKIQSHSVHTTLTAEELEGFKKRGMEAMKESGMIVEIEPEEKNDRVD